MPRILRIINRFNIGGPTYNAAYLTKYLSPEFETLLIGGVCEPTEESSGFILNNLGISAVTLPSMRRAINPFSDLTALKEIKKIIREFKPDIVHTHASKAGILGRRAAYSLKVPVIVHTFHGHVFDGYFGKIQSSFYQQVERRYARMSTRIIAISNIQKYDLTEKYRICPPEKVEVIPLGFDLDRFRTGRGEKRDIFRKKYGIADDEIVISIIGRIVPIKNHGLFLEAIRYLKENTTKKIRAFIVGDGEDKDKIMGIAASLGLDVSDAVDGNTRATVTFTSWIKEIDVVTSGSDIIALTSINEGTPVSLIEAQASGKAVISTRVGGIEDIVIPGKTALLSGPSDTESFCKNLLLLVENENMRNEFGAHGWNFVHQRFHYSRLVSDTAALYRRLLQNHR